MSIDTQEEQHLKQLSLELYYIVDKHRQYRKDPAVAEELRSLLTPFFQRLDKRERYDFFSYALSHYEENEERRGYGYYAGSEGADAVTVFKAVTNSGDIDLWKTITEGFSTDQKLRLFGAHDGNGGNSIWHLLANGQNPELLRDAVANLNTEQKIKAFSGVISPEPSDSLLEDKHIGETVWHLVVKNKNPEFLKIAFEGLSPEQKFDVLRLQRQTKSSERVGSVVDDANKDVAFEGLNRIQRLQVQASRENEVKNKKEDGTEKTLKFESNGSRVLTNKDSEGRFTQTTKRADGSLFERKTVDTNWATKTAPINGNPGILEK